MQVRHYSRQIRRLALAEPATLRELGDFVFRHFYADFEATTAPMHADWKQLYRTQHDIFQDGIVQLAGAVRDCMARCGLARGEVSAVGVAIALSGMIGAMKMLRRHDPHLAGLPAVRAVVAANFAAALGAASGLSAADIRVDPNADDEGAGQGEGADRRLVPGHG